MLCHPKLNLTVVTTIISVNNLLLLNQEDNRLYGTAGDFYQGILSKLNGKRSYCRIIPSYTIGGRLKNGTPYGALGYLIRQEADVYFRKEAPFYLDSENLLLSNTVAHDEIISAHAFKLEEKGASKSVNFGTGLLKFLDLKLLIYLCISVMLSTLVMFLFVHCLLASDWRPFKWSRLKHICTSLLTLFYPDHKLLLITSVCFIYLSHLIVLEFFKVLSFNSIKTDNVVCDTSALIKNFDDIWKTKRETCWMIGEIDSYLFSSAPRGSTMWKIWQTKNSPNEICRFEKSFANSKFIRESQRYFWLSRKSTVHFLALVISKLIPIKLWMNEDFVLYNFFLSFYMKSSIQPAKRKWIDKTVTSYIQADLMNPEVYLKFRQYAYNLNVLVTSIDSFVEEHTTTREFTIDDYYHYFTLFCCIYASTFIAFCLHHCYRLFRTNRNLVLPFSD